jgi:hypothetical protein
MGSEDAPDEGKLHCSVNSSEAFFQFIEEGKEH